MGINASGNKDESGKKVGTKGWKGPEDKAPKVHFNIHFPIK